MLKEGVRLDRVRGGRQKYRRLIDNPYAAAAAAAAAAAGGGGVAGGAHLQPPRKMTLEGT